MSRSTSLAANTAAAFILLALIALIAMLLLPGKSSAAILITNNPGGSTTWVLSSQAPAAESGLTSLAADDFVVPSTKVWQVTKVVAYGTYDKPDPLKVSRVNVGFFRTANGLGPMQHAFRSQLDLKPSGSTEDGILDIKTSMVVPPGRNWLAVQPAFSTSDNSQLWLWQAKGNNFGLSAHVQNPGGANYPTCPTWTPVEMCSAAGPSLRFRLEGFRTDSRFGPVLSKFLRKPGAKFVFEIKVNVTNIGKLKVKAKGFKTVKKKIRKIGIHKVVLRPKASTLAKYRAGKPVTAKVKYQIPAIVPKGVKSAPATAETTGELRVAAD